MTFDQLEYFRVVAEEENVFRASQRLHITQQGLSANIIKIEKELGVYLFDRVGRQIFLNDKGKLFVQYVDRILLDYQAAKDALIQHEAEQPKIITVASTGRNILSRTVVGFLSCHEDIKINSLHIGCNEIGRVLAQDEANFVITSVPYTASDVDCCVLFEEPIVLAMADDHPLANRESISISELKDIPFTLPDTNDAFRKDVDAIFSRADFVPNVVLTASSSDVIMRALLKRIAVAAYGKYAYDEATLPKHIVFVPLKEEFAKRRIYLLWKRTGIDPDHLRKFRNYARDNTLELMLNPML